MRYYLEGYRAGVGTKAGSLAGLRRRVVSRLGDASQATSLYLGLTALSPTILVVLLIISGTEQNPGPVVNVETTLFISHVEEATETSRREHDLMRVVI
jgi:hypothetical protein